MADEFTTKTEDLTLAKTGKELVTEPQLNPIDEAKRINDELQANIKEMRSLKDEMQKASAYMMISGRAQAGQAPKEKTQAEIDQEAADKLIKRFRYK